VSLTKTCPGYRAFSGALEIYVPCDAPGTDPMLCYNNSICWPPLGEGLRTAGLPKF